MSQEESKIVLYDIPSKQGVCWSLNTWKPRMVLNFKGLDYETEWVEYPDIAPKLKSFGIPPADSDPPYTLPAIKTADGEYIMDSRKIAEYLEKKYPPGDYPSLELGDPIEEEVRKHLGQVWAALRPVVLPKLPRDLLNPPSVEYFQKTRKDVFGMTLDELESTKGGDPAWKDAEKPIDDLSALLRISEGPYFLGGKASYADFYVVSVLAMIKCVDEKLYDRFTEGRQEYRDLFTVFQAYMDKKD